MEELIDKSTTTGQPSAEPVSPAPAADEKKPGDPPASGAEDKNSEQAVETPEQIAAKSESRRARSNARKAQALADARAEAKLLREERDRLLAEKATPKPGSDEPKREQFENLEDYYRAVARYEAKQESAAAEKRLSEKQQGTDEQRRQAEKNAERDRSWTEREKEFQKAAKDYEAVVTPFVEDELQDLHRSAREAIVEMGPALLYHLATHTEEVERIAKLSAARQIAELGKLEATALTKTAKPSAAPDPTKPLGQGSAGTKDPNKMSDAEYKQYRKSQGARWAQ